MFIVDTGLPGFTNWPVVHWIEVKKKKTENRGVNSVVKNT